MNTLAEVVFAWAFWGGLLAAYRACLWMFGQARPGALRRFLLAGVAVVIGLTLLMPPGAWSQLAAFLHGSRRPILFVFLFNCFYGLAKIKPPSVLQGAKFAGARLVDLGVIFPGFYVYLYLRWPEVLKLIQTH